MAFCLNRFLLITFLAGAVLFPSRVDPIELKPRIEALLSKALGARIEIRELHWTSLSEVSAEGIVAKKEGVVIARADRLRIVGAPSALLKMRVVLDTLEVLSPSIRVYRDGAGRWELPVLNLREDASSGGKPAGLFVEIRHGMLRDASIETGGEETPASLKGMDLDFSLLRTGDGLSFRFRDLNFELEAPPLFFRNGRGTALFRPGHIDLTGIQIETELSSLRVDGYVRGLSDPKIDLSLNAEPLASEELKSLLPNFPFVGPLGLTAFLTGSADSLAVSGALNTVGGVLEGSVILNPRVSPVTYDSIALKAKGLDLSGLAGRGGTTDLNFMFNGTGAGLGSNNATLEGSFALDPSWFMGRSISSPRLQIRLKEGHLRSEGKIRIGRGAFQGKAELTITETPTPYRIHGEVLNLDLATLTGNEDLKSRLVGRIEINGSGMDLDGMDMKGRGVFKKSEIRGYTFGAVETGLRFERRILTLDRLVLNAPEGKAQGTFRVAFPADRPWSYGGEIDVSSLDLGIVTGDSSYHSDLNLAVTVAGEEMGELSFRVEGDESTLIGIPIEDLLAGGSLQGGVWTVKRLDLNSGDMAFQAVGKVGPSDSIDMRANVRGEVSASFKGMDLAFQGDASGVIQGRLGNLKVVVSGRSDSFQVGETRFGDALFDLDINGVDVRRDLAGIGSTVLGDLTLSVGEFGIKSFRVNDVIAGFLLSPGVADFGLNISPTEDVRIEAAGLIRFGREGLVARLDTLFADLEKAHLKNEGRSHLHYAYGGGFRLDSLRVVQETGALTVNGEVDEGGSIQADIRLDGIDLNVWENLLGRKDGISGILNLRASASGELRDPVLTGQVAISDGRVSDFAYHRLGGEFGYRGGRATVDFHLNQDIQPSEGSPLGPRELILQGAFPFPANPGGTLDLQVRSEDLDLSFLQTAFPDFKEVSGKLQGDLWVKGTVQDPIFTGFVEIPPGGRLKVQSLGLSLEDVRLRVDGTPEGISLTNLNLKTKGGALDAEGRIDLEGLRMNTFDVTINVRDFDLLDRKDAQLTIKGEMRLAGERGRPELKGDLVVQRALISLGPDQGGRSSFWDSDFIRELECHGRLSIPRNAWIRADNFSAEVHGDIEVRKSGPGFVLYGGVETIRGEYVFQNAAFSIERGEVRFQGTPDNDPNLYILGTRRIPRVLPDANGNNTRDLQINLVVGGTIQNPQVSLESDAPTPLDQADLLSYLLFGLPANQSLLGSVGGGGGAENVQAQAQILAMGIAANRLKRTVGRELGLDVLEVELGGGKETLTRLAVGKYVRPDLLLTFSQDYIPEDGQGLERMGRKVSVEYELGRHFGLSGSMDDRRRTELDLIWKREW